MMNRRTFSPACRGIGIVLLSATPIVAQQGPTLRPISVNEAVALAQRNAPSAVQARGQIRSANSAVRSAYGALLPSLSVSMGQTQQSGDRLGQSGDIVPYSGQPWTYSTGLNMNLNLFDGGRRWSDLARTRAEVGSAEANEITQRYTIALQVKTQYFNVLAARESEGAARARLEQAEQQLRVATARVRAGAATLSDSLRSLILVGDARLALLTAENSIRVASASLTRLVGSSELVTANPADTVSPVTALPDSAELTRFALEGPLVKEAEAARLSAVAARRVARASYLPSVNLSYRRSGGGYDNMYGLGSKPFPYQNSIGISLSYSVFDNFAREDAQVRASVSAQNAEASLRDARLLVQQNVIAQLGSLRTAEQRIAIQQASVIAAQEDLRVMQQRYSLGASTLLDLLTSQTALNAARQALIEARRDYRIARAQLETVVGRDLP
jgi:outer membrane protein